MYNFFHSFSVLGIVILTIFSGGHHATTQHNPPVVHEVVANHKDNPTITAQGSVSKFGQTVTFTITFPENGGNAQGTIGGACTGNILGIYGGKDLSGTANASCPVLLTTITGTAVFKGHVNPDNKTAELHAKVMAQGMSEDIEIPLTLSE